MLADEVDARDMGALLSPCRRWRYLLWRFWDRDLRVMAFVGLNPSTADEIADDPTIRRVKGYARTWGYGGVLMLNAYAWRATDPREMKAQGANALGPVNNQYLLTVGRLADRVVAGWGANIEPARQIEIAKMYADAGIPLYALNLTRGGFPAHPLYLPKTLTARRVNLLAPVPHFLTAV